MNYKQISHRQNWPALAELVAALEASAAPPPMAPTVAGTPRRDGLADLRASYRTRNRIDAERARQEWRRSKLQFMRRGGNFGRRR